MGTFSYEPYIMGMKQITNNQKKEFNMNTDNVQYYCVGCDKKSTEKKYNDKRLEEYVPYFNTFDTVPVPDGTDENGKGYISWGLKCMDCGHIE